MWWGTVVFSAHLCTHNFNNYTKGGKKRGRINNKILPKLGKIDLSKIHLKTHLEIPVISPRKMLNLFSKYDHGFH